MDAGKVKNDIQSCRIWIRYINQNSKPSNRCSEDQGIGIYLQYVLAILFPP